MGILYTVALRSCHITGTDGATLVRNHHSTSCHPSVTLLGHQRGLGVCLHSLGALLQFGLKFTVQVAQKVAFIVFKSRTLGCEPFCQFLSGFPYVEVQLAHF